MIRSDNLNWHDHGSYTEITDPYLNVNATNKDESKRIIVQKNVIRELFYRHKRIKTQHRQQNVSQKNSANVSEYTITEIKDKEYKEPSVTKEVKSYFKIFECGRNLSDILDVTHQGAFMSTLQDKYYTKFLDTLVKDNNRNGAPLSNEKLRQSVRDVRE